MDIARRLRQHGFYHRRFGQLVKRGAAALRHHHFFKQFIRFAVVQHRLQFSARVFAVGGEFAIYQGFRAQRERDFVQTRVAAAFAAQITHRFAHFHRVARAGSQHFVHVGEQGGGLAARVGRHLGDALRQFARKFVSGHKRAVAHFHIHHQAG